MGHGRQSRVPSARDSSIWVAAEGWGRAGGSGTSTKPREVEGIAMGAACRVRHLFFEVRQAQP